jgi:hypothetical protein
MNAGFSTRTDLILVPGAIEAAASRGKSGGSQMRSKPSPQHKIGEQIGKELRAIYDDVLHEPIPDRFRVLMDRLGEELASTAPAPGPTSRVAPPLTTGRVPRAAARVPEVVRSLPRGVTRLERA